VQYLPGNPQQARIDSFFENWLAVLILGSLGMVLTATGGAIFLAGVRQRKRDAWLATKGVRVQAKFESVNYNTRMEGNGRSPWQLICQWQHPVTKKVYVFASENIWFDPTTFVKRDTLDVLVDMDNPKRYRVDTSFLPPAG
jgi:hypothetical protein